MLLYSHYLFFFPHCQIMWLTDHPFFKKRWKIQTCSQLWFSFGNVNVVFLKWIPCVLKLMKVLHLTLIASLFYSHKRSPEVLYLKTQNHKYALPQNCKTANLYHSDVHVLIQSLLNVLALLIILISCTGQENQNRLTGAIGSFKMLNVQLFKTQWSQKLLFEVEKSFL